MTQPPHLNQKKARIIARGMADSRVHKRVELPVEGQFEDGHGHHRACKLLDASPGGGRIQSATPVLTGETVTIELEPFGKLTGEVVRAVAGEFSVRWVGGPRKRERLADLLTWAHNAKRMEVADERRGGRQKRTGRVRVLFEDGTAIDAMVADVSATGLGLHSDKRPPLGAPIRVGRLTGEVARYTPDGFALRLDPPARPAAAKPAPQPAEAEAEPEKVSETDTDSAGRD